MRIFGFEIKRAVQQIAEGHHRTTTITADAPFAPPVGSEVTLGGFIYRVRKYTDKDLVLRPIGVKP